MYTERLVDSVVGRARVVMTVSCVARSDSRSYWWRPTEVRLFLKETDVSSLCCVLEGSRCICMSR